jgi:hypothetical protein
MPRQAAALADLYQSAQADNREDPAEALGRLPAGRGICHAISLREFEVQVCGERDCLKYCPDGSCATTTTPVTDTDPWCWCCGKPWVPWDACPWLD